MEERRRGIRVSDAKMIAEYIRKHGVTRCPTAIVAPTTATLSDADVIALERAEQQRVTDWHSKNTTVAQRIFRRRRQIVRAAQNAKPSVLPRRSVRRSSRAGA